MDTIADTQEDLCSRNDVEAKNTSEHVQPAARKKNRIGRKGRRKRKKLLQMEAALAAVEEGEKVSPIDGLLPTDRDYRWPAVEDLCTMEDTDKKSIIGQLGYYPGNALSVAARVNEAFPDSAMFKGDDSPLILKLYPLVLRDEADGTKSRRKRRRQYVEESSLESINDLAPEEGKKNPVVEPFPTIYWVTHPYLRVLISKLELENRGSYYEKCLKEDAEALKTMQQAHTAYGKERHSMITHEDRDYITKRRWDSALDPSRGVAGIRNYAGIKCLHAHAAHLWSGCQENIVGRWVVEEVSKYLHDTDQERSSSNANE